MTILPEKELVSSILGNNALSLGEFFPLHILMRMDRIWNGTQHAQFEIDELSDRQVGQGLVLSSPS